MLACRPTSAAVIRVLCTGGGRADVGIGPYEKTGSEAVEAACMAAPDCRKTSLKMSVTEQRGKCEGGKKPPSRSIDTYF